VELSREINLLAFPRHPAWVVGRNRGGFWLKILNIRSKKPFRQARLTIGTIKSTIALNFGRLHRLRRNATLAPLVTRLPAGNSLTLADSRVLSGLPIGSAFTLDRQAVKKVKYD
jgi:hypothetical protein